MRWAVIGDVGGHLPSLQAELMRLGVDLAAARIPEDLTVVQVGDLVHRGPDSAAVVALVDALLRGNPGRWVQLVGNHEAYYLRPPTFRWPEKLDRRTVATLRAWQDDGLLRAGVAVPAPGGDVLVTHAGVTADFWQRILAAPADAGSAAARLDALARHDSDDLYRPGVMLTGVISGRAGPVWAEDGRELVAGWLGRTLPFSQVHGHSSMWDWQAGAWRFSALATELVRLDPERSHLIVQLDGGVLVGIDPGHGDEATTTWRSWEPTAA